MTPLSNDPELLLKDVLDQKIPQPAGQVAEEVVFVVNVALACTRTAPDTRPSMRFVAQELSAKTQSCLSEPFGEIPKSLANVSGLQYLVLLDNKLIGRYRKTFVHAADCIEFQQQFSLRTKDFVGNSGLCGDVTELSACKSSLKIGNTMKILIGILVPVNCLFILGIIFAGIICRRLEKYLDEEIKSSKKYDWYESTWEREGRFTFGDILKAINEFDEKHFQALMATWPQLNAVRHTTDNCLSWLRQSA
ncbi:hypothetical protein ACFE04_032029 [Oxalis oulophora]